MAFTPVLLTGTFQGASGAAASGTLTFTLTEAMENGNVIITPAPIIVTLDGSGHFSTSLLANDDVGTAPAGVWYGVTEQLNSAQPRDYFIVISATGPNPVQLSSLMPTAGAWR